MRISVDLGRVLPASTGICAVLMLLLSCSSTPSDLKKMGPNLYNVKGGNVGGYLDQGNLIARGKADTFCRKKGKVMAGIFDRPPTADFVFKCIPRSEDPALR